MNQNDLIQKIIATERQAQALTVDARSQQENIEKSIDDEIAALRTQYQEKAEHYLDTLRQREQEIRVQHLSELDVRLQTKLTQIENIYSTQKDAWVNAIFERIVGKAGG